VLLHDPPCQEKPHDTVDCGKLLTYEVRPSLYLQILPQFLHRFGKTRAIFLLISAVGFVRPETQRNQNQDYILGTLTVPKDERKGLADLLELSDKVFADFLIAIEQSPESLREISGLPADASRLLAETLNNLYVVRAYHDVPTDEFVSDVFESLTEHGELKPSDESRFRERLLRLLDIESLTVTAKGLVLQGEYAYTFCDVRIMTDIRPVFGQDVSAPPPAMLLTHTLKIDYHGTAGHLHEFYIALRPDDLAQLREVLDRAEVKAKSLESLLKPLNTRLIGIQE